MASPSTAVESDKIATGWLQLFSGILSLNDAVSAVQALETKARNVFALLDRWTAGIGAQKACPHVRKRVTVHCKLCVDLLAKMGISDGGRVDLNIRLSVNDILLAHRRLDTIAETLTRESLSPHPLLGLPDVVTCGHIMPLLDTITLVGSLSRTHPAVNTSPAIMAPDQLRITSKRPIHMTHQQMEAWRPRLRQAKRAVLRCPLTTSMARLVEGARASLMSLEAHTAEKEMDRAVEREGPDLTFCDRPFIFPLLESVVVTGAWGDVADMRSWRPSNLRSLEMHPAPRLPGEAEVPSPVYSGAEAWMRWCGSAKAGVHTATLGGWDLANAVAKLGPYLGHVKRLEGMVVGRPRYVIYYDVMQPSTALDALQATIKPPGGKLDLATIRELHGFRESCLAPRAKEDYSQSDFTFPVSLLIAMTDDDLRTYKPTLILLAPLATRVSFPTGLQPGLQVPMEIYRLLPLLTFSRAHTLALDEASEALEPLPQGLLSWFERPFPAVCTLDLAEGRGERGEAVVHQAVRSIKQLQTIRFWPDGSADDDSDSDEAKFGYSLPLCLRNYSGKGPLFHLQGHFADKERPWTLTVVSTGQTGEPADHIEERPISQRVQRITAQVTTVQARASDVFCSTYSPHEPGFVAALAAACLSAVTQLPSVDVIVLECTEGPVDEEDYEWHRWDDGIEWDEVSLASWSEAERQVRIDDVWAEEPPADPPTLLDAVELARVIVRDSVPERTVLFRSDMAARGFECVALPQLAVDCRIEIRRRGLSMPAAGQKRITDYFTPLTH
ncbi:unnamed protein product [Vitrella brassicaformis CCMP3155]|uniref:Uncharacterized protein n=1 Tax=Vitrella brassicaformis (strain CCMP3155) TaxID=1169540 RepID=A0A0G4GYT5_VITBC|nr:unnamed protein product [Vitrella brassicaformis CCMP3155]|eukprot:CEM36372.1 unnamed protein product [Vitrella brassicaformis CCMP3155]